MVRYYSAWIESNPDFYRSKSSDIQSVKSFDGSCSIESLDGSKDAELHKTRIQFDGERMQQVCC